MKIHQFHNQKGFTLIELLLYMVIATVMVIMLSGVSIAMLRTTHKVQLLQDVHYTNSFIYTTLQRVASGAYAVSSPVGSATSSSVTFRMYDTSIDPVIFSLMDGVVYITEGSAVAVPLHQDDMESIVTFTNVTPEDGYDSVKVQLSVSAVSESSLASFNAIQTIDTTLTLHFTP